MHTVSRQAAARPRTLCSAARRQRSWQQIADCSLQSALSHCHIAGRFSLAIGQAFIGHIVIWILLVILPFGFNSMFLCLARLLSCYCQLLSHIGKAKKPWKRACGMGLS
jgi:hypothetical protein